MESTKKKYSFDTIMLKVLSGYSIVTTEEWLEMPVHEREKMILNDHVVFISKKNIVAVKDALQSLKDAGHAEKLPFDTIMVKVGVGYSIFSTQEWLDLGREKHEEIIQNDRVVFISNKPALICVEDALQSLENIVRILHIEVPK